MEELSSVMIQSALSVTSASHSVMPVGVAQKQSFSMDTIDDLQDMVYASRVAFMRIWDTVTFMQQEAFWLKELVSTEKQPNPNVSPCDDWRWLGG